MTWPNLKFFCILLVFSPSLAAKHLPPPEPIVHARIDPLRWTNIALPAQVLHLTSHQNLGKKCMWVTGKNELIASSCDGGLSWRIDHLSRQRHWIFTLASAGRRAFLAFGTGKRVWRSKDRGMNWREIHNSPIPVQYARFTPRGDGILASTGMMAYRLGHARHWTRRQLWVHGHPAWVQGLAILDSARAALLLQPNSMIFCTQDGGRHWNTFSFPHGIVIDNIMSLRGQYIAIGHHVSSSKVSPALFLSGAGVSWSEIKAPDVAMLNGCHGGGICPAGKYLVHWRLQENSFYVGFDRTPPMMLDYFASASAHLLLCKLGQALQCGRMVPVSLREVGPHADEKLGLVRTLKNHGTLKRISGRRVAYPAGALNSGAVVLLARISRSGMTLPLNVEYAPYRYFARSVIRAVRTWRYRTDFLKGNLRHVYIQIAINFKGPH